MSEQNQAGASYKIKGTRTQDESAHHQPTHSTALHAANGCERAQAVMSRGCSCGGAGCSNCG
jgi:hypothetical protein